MGLDVSHGAFSASYGSFNLMRQCLLEAIGGSFPPHYMYGEDGFPLKGSNGWLMRKEGKDDNRIYFPNGGLDDEKDAGLIEFIMHSDCDGEISPEMCIKVADELDALLPKIEALGWGNTHPKSMVDIYKQFIAGCRLAAKEGAPLEFR